MPSKLGIAKSRHALAVRHHGADSPQARDTKKKLAAEKTAVYIERLLREAPELDAQQCANLVELLRPVGIRAGGAA